MMNMSSLSNLRICSLFGAGLSGATVLAGWSHGDLPLYTMLAMATAVFSMAIFLFALKTRASIVVVSQALARLADGDFEARIADSDEGGELGDIVHRINLFADVADAFVRESEATAEAMTAGKFHRRFVERGLPGRFSLAARNLNAAAISLSNATEFRRNSMLQMAGAAESEAGGVADDVSYLTNEVSEAANNLHKMSLRTSESAASGSWRV